MFNNDELAILWLDIFDFLTINKKQDIIKLFETPSEMYDNFASQKQEILKHISLNQYDKMMRMKNSQNIDKYIKYLEDSKIKFTTFCSDDYPEFLFDYNNNPLILYYKGDLNLLYTNCVGVVGTRKYTRYGERVTENYCEKLALNGVTIVSGFAEGIDSIESKTAIKNNGKTIAIIGSGLNSLYPKSNLKFSEEVAKKGLIMSEYPPYMQAQTFHFPQRNRLIAACSQCVLITEAGIKSGVMYTKDYALEYGKEVFVVPGNIDSEASKGANAIIKSLQGSITIDPSDILEFLAITDNSKQDDKTEKGLSEEEKMVLECIGGNEVHFNEIQIKTKLDTKYLLTLLTTMELNGLIKKLAGNYYAK